MQQEQSISSQNLSDSRLSRSGFHSKKPSDSACLLYTSDAADEEDSADLGGRRIIKKKKKNNETRGRTRPGNEKVTVVHVETAWTDAAAGK